MAVQIGASLIQAWAMSKYFRPWNIDQTLLLPPNVQDFVPKGHVSRFIIDLVRESLDLKEITGSYVSGKPFTKTYRRISAHSTVSSTKMMKANSAPSFRRVPENWTST